MNNNYNSNTVVKQDFAVVEQVDGRVKSLESNCNVLVALRKKFRKIFLNRAPKKIRTPLPNHAGSIPGYSTIKLAC